MNVCNQLCDGEAKTRSFCKGPRFVDTIKTTEDMGQRILWNAHASVLNNDVCFRALNMETNRDLSAVGCVFDGLVQQDPEETSQAGGIGHDPYRSVAMKTGDQGDVAFDLQSSQLLSQRL